MAIGSQRKHCQPGWEFFINICTFISIGICIYVSAEVFILGFWVVNSMIDYNVFRHCSYYIILLILYLPPSSSLNESPFFLHFSEQVTWTLIYLLLLLPEPVAPTVIIFTSYFLLLPRICILRFGARGLQWKRTYNVYLSWSGSIIYLQSSWFHFPLAAE